MASLSVNQENSIELYQRELWNAHGTEIELKLVRLTPVGLILMHSDELILTSNNKKSVYTKPVDYLSTLLN